MSDWMEFTLLALILSPFLAFYFAVAWRIFRDE